MKRARRGSRRTAGARLRRRWSRTVSHRERQRYQKIDVVDPCDERCGGGRAGGVSRVQGTRCRGRSRAGRGRSAGGGWGNCGVDRTWPGFPALGWGEPGHGLERPGHDGWRRDEALAGRAPRARTGPLRRAHGRKPQRHFDVSGQREHACAVRRSGRSDGTVADVIFFWAGLPRFALSRISGKRRPQRAGRKRTSGRRGGGRKTRRAPSRLRATGARPEAAFACARPGPGRAGARVARPNADDGAERASRVSARCGAGRCRRGGPGRRCRWRQ